MFLIPKNIKVKREIFKGYGIKEIALIMLSILIGFVLAKLFGSGLIKIFLFSFFPILMVLLTLPLPTGKGNILDIFIKMSKYVLSQKKYKKYYWQNMTLFDMLNLSMGNSNVVLHWWSKQCGNPDTI